MTKLALDLDDETLAGLKRIAQREGRSLEDVAHSGLAELAANENTYELTEADMATIQASIDDPCPSIPHEVVMAELREANKRRAG